MTEDRTVRAEGYEAQANRALMLVCLYSFAAALLLVVVVMHPAVFVKVIAAVGAIVAVTFVAYWTWWYRAYRRMRRMS